MVSQHNLMFDVKYFILRLSKEIGLTLMSAKVLVSIHSRISTTKEILHKMADPIYYPESASKSQSAGNSELFLIYNEQ